ncbi:MAG: Tex family protein [Pseudomonadota bacterium]|nr:Tex family protein [Pseudomonadota bacterium]
MTPFDPVPGVARSLALPPRGVAAVIILLADGNTVPFIARYRKESTGGLDEVQIGAVETAWKASLALEKRREAIRSAIAEQGKLTLALNDQIRACDDKQALEDLYLPFKRKRKTRASVARERGLESLAERILAQAPGGDPERDAARFLGPDVPDAAAALAGARDIVAEVVSERPELRATARTLTIQHGRLTSKAVKKATDGERTRFEDYYAFAEAVTKVAPHRYLAIRRGETEEVLRVGIAIDADAMAERLQALMHVAPRSPWAGELREAVRDGYVRLLAPSIENEVRSGLDEWAEAEAVGVFGTNLRNLLLSPAYGKRAVVAMDPGFRTGCKCAALGPTGTFLGAVTVFPHTTRDPSAAAAELVAFVRRHKAEAVAVGSGTAGRETFDFARKALADASLNAVSVVTVSEVGASVYSASEIAREEFPDLDLTVRGAISIGRRLQDPLAELVKVDPKSLGVGQYQHDVTEGLLAERLDSVVASCVNHVGVELDTASAPLLTQVSGIGPTLARRIVAYRDEHGPFPSRAKLLQVPGLGPKTFEQAAGFLRIRGAAHPLDASAVHPERYALVERMAKDLGVDVRRLVGDAALVARIDVRRYVGADVGEPTLRDILTELARPGRDPRDTFEAPRFRDDVRTLDDLAPGMELEGIVTNVTSFGAFVDIGVHQDGLVHVSELADRYVKDPLAVVQVGKRLAVRVVSVDRERKRIALSARVKPVH